MDIFVLLSKKCYSWKLNASVGGFMSFEMGKLASLSSGIPTHDHLAERDEAVYYFRNTLYFLAIFLATPLESSWNGWLQETFTISDNVEFGDGCKSGVASFGEGDRMKMNDQEQRP